MDAAGVVWIADTGNNRIRKLVPAPVAAAEEILANITVVSAATLQPGPIAPGAIVSIFGTGLGPVAAAGGILQPNGILSAQIADTQVLFDGRPAALFYVQESQINAQTPYETAGQTTTQIEVLYKGTSRGRTTVSLAAAAPAFFTLGQGSGQAAALNEDGTLNSEGNPAPKGSLLTLYATGAGQLTPVGVDGKAATLPLGRPSLPVTVIIGVYAADVLYAGEAPGFAGLLQLNVRLPGGFAPTGPQNVVLQIGSAVSQGGVTVAIR